ncbi:MAG: glycoside hydrolase family 73 protein [Patescibacteria group bacterium]
MTKREFVQKILSAAEEAQAKGARFNLAVLCAQAAHESGWGMSKLALRANNLFGIKATPSWKGPRISMKTWEVYNGVRHDNVPASWRVYPNYAVCILDYAEIIATRRWFKAALEHLDDAEAFLRALLPAPGKPGWATDPQYFEKVRAAARLVESLGGPAWEVNA